MTEMAEACRQQDHQRAGWTRAEQRKGIFSQPFAKIIWRVGSRQVPSQADRSSAAARRLLAPGRGPRYRVQHLAP
jgi:hypothetical protein